MSLSCSRPDRVGLKKLFKMSRIEHKSRLTIDAKVVGIGGHLLRHARPILLDQADLVVLHVAHLNEMNAYVEATGIIPDIRHRR